MDQSPREVTQLLERARAGDREAENRLYEVVLPHLRRMAQHLLNAERPQHTWQGTELVHEMYLRLAGTKLSLRDRHHFFAIAARAMRRELIDYARSRPNVNVLPLDGLPEAVLGASTRIEATLAIDELLDQLREAQPLESSIVEMKIFFGMTDEEVAEVLGMPLRSAQARWHDARIWLFEKAQAQQWKPTRTLKPQATS